MRVILTGSRRWDDAKTIRLALDAVATGATEAHAELLTIVHGFCPNGADTIGDMWVRSWTAPDLTVTAERHPALWQKFGKRAGIVRNEQMVAAGADLVLSFIRDNSPGATHCTELALEVGIPVRLWRYGVPGVESFDGRHLADEDVI